AALERGGIRFSPRQTGRFLRATKPSRQARGVIDSSAASSFTTPGGLQAPSEVPFLAYEHPRRKITVENAIKITKSQTKLTAIRSDRSNLHLRPMLIHSQI